MRNVTRFGIGRCCTYDFFQYSIGDAPVKAVALAFDAELKTFNTPLEMLATVVPGMLNGYRSSFNTPLEMLQRPVGCSPDFQVGKLSILHWRCRTSLSSSSALFKPFQYSIGDAQTRPSSSPRHALQLCFQYSIGDAVAARPAAPAPMAAQVFQYSIGDALFAARR